MWPFHLPSEKSEDENKKFDLCMSHKMSNGNNSAAAWICLNGDGSNMGGNSHFEVYNLANKE